MKNKKQIEQILKLIADTLIEAVQTGGPLGTPGGTLYAALMPLGCTLEQFEAIMGALRGNHGRASFRWQVGKARAALFCQGGAIMLGNNRDYKTADRRARTQLARHAARMAELIVQGLERAAASKQAFAEMEQKRKAAAK